jgi:NitT/TauT family transport system substrate-binding protein
MGFPMSATHTRRRFLATMAMAGAATLQRPPVARAGESPLETTSVRLLKAPGLCVAPQYLCEELLRAEGFTRIEYVDEPDYNAALPRGQVDFTMNYATNFVRSIDAGGPIILLAGVHVGCYELFAQAGIRSIADLKGKSVGVQALGSNPHVLVSLLAAQVGLDPVKDIHWVTDPSVKPIERFVDGKIDAFLGYPPEPQELRDKHIGNVIVNTAVDRPWSQYFCCMLGGHRDYVRNNPAATKRVLRAILKAADFCAGEPARAARGLVDASFTARYDYALQMLSEVPYDKWREYDAEDTIRFFALRLHEVGFIKSSPQKIIADGTDWRFLDELKRELKA